MLYRYLSIFCVSLMLLGCAESSLLAQSYKNLSKGNGGRVYKVGSPYKIRGIRYYPKEEWDYVETGIASWYGDEFHGKRTANGDTFNKWALTAAHRTLPMPSVVKVTNLENGRSIELTVNDRGPFAHGRIIDVSHRAADLLGFTNNGTAKVKVSIVKNKSLAMKAALTNQPLQAVKEEVQLASFTVPEADPTLPQPKVAYQEILPQHVETKPLLDEPTQTALRKQEAEVEIEPVKESDIYVQVAAFRLKSNAERLKDQMRHLGRINVVQAEVNGQNFYRVRVGPITDVSSADSVLNSALQSGLKESRIVVD